MVNTTISTYRVLRRIFPANIVGKILLEVDFENILVKNCREVLDFACVEWIESLVECTNPDIALEIMKHVELPLFGDIAKRIQQNETFKISARWQRYFSISRAKECGHLCLKRYGHHSLLSTTICCICLKSYIYDIDASSTSILYNLNTAGPSYCSPKSCDACHLRETVDDRICLWKKAISKAFKKNIPILKCVIDMALEENSIFLIMTFSNCMLNHGYGSYKTWVHYIAFKSSGYFFNEFFNMCKSMISNKWWKENIISIALLILDNIEEFTIRPTIISKMVLKRSKLEILLPKVPIYVNVVVDKNNNTLLHHAVLKNNIEVCRILARSVSIQGEFVKRIIVQKNSKGQTAYDLSIEFPEIRKYFDLPICWCCGYSYDNIMCDKCGYKPRNSAIP